MKMTALIMLVIVVFLSALIEELYAKKRDTGPAPMLMLGVSPLVVVNPTNFRATLGIPADENNRYATLVWSLDGVRCGSTFFQIDGEDGPIRFNFTTERLSAARYLFVAELFGVDRKPRARASVQVEAPEEKK